LKVNLSLDNIASHKGYKFENYFDTLRLLRLLFYEYPKRYEDETLKVLRYILGSRIFTCPDEIVQPLLKTNNEIKNRKLPFDRIFLDVRLELCGKIIKGVYIGNALDSNNKIINEIAYLGLKHEPSKQERPWACFDSIFTMDDNLNETDFKTSTELDSIWTPQEKKDNITIRKKIKLFVCNFLDFINTSDVELIEVERDWERNEKRIRRGKPPIPAQTIVKLKPQIRIYLDQLKSGKHFKFSHKFWVRGHWRTLRSERWGDLRGTKIWIKPYIKGQGILIEKNYDVIPVGVTS
jgi:hypothetical protein